MSVRFALFITKHIMDSIYGNSALGMSVTVFVASLPGCAEHSQRFLRERGTRETCCVWWSRHVLDKSVHPNYITSNSIYRCADMKWAHSHWTRIYASICFACRWSLVEYTTLNSGRKINLLYKRAMSLIFCRQVYVENLFQHGSTYVHFQPHLDVPLFVVRLQIDIVD